MPKAEASSSTDRAPWRTHSLTSRSVIALQMQIYILVLQAWLSPRPIVMRMIIVCFVAAVKSHHLMISCTWFRQTCAIRSDHCEPVAHLSSQDAWLGNARGHRWHE